MSLSRLTLISGHGDQTLGNIKFVVVGLGATTAGGAFERGLPFVEGQSVVSTNIVHALNQAGAEAAGAGSVVVCAVPANFYLGYGVFTTAYVDRVLKRVTGAPMRYAGARNELAFYTGPDTESGQARVESEWVAESSPVQRPQFMVEPNFLIGRFRGPGLDQVIRSIVVSTQAFEAVNYAQYEEALRELFEPTMPANMVLAPTVMRDVLIGTVESLVMTELRLMRWQGLAMLGYSFSEGHQPITVKPADGMSDQQRMIDETGRRLASSALFTGELAWLKTYVAHELDMMRVELEAAELDSA